MRGTGRAETSPAARPIKMPRTGRVRTLCPGRSTSRISSSCFVPAEASDNHDPSASATPRRVSSMRTCSEFRRSGLSWQLSVQASRSVHNASPAFSHARTICIYNIINATRHDASSPLALGCSAPPRCPRRAGSDPRPPASCQTRRSCEATCPSALAPTHTKTSLTSGGLGGSCASARTC